MLIEDHEVIEACLSFGFSGVQKLHVLRIKLSQLLSALTELRY